MGNCSNRYPQKPQDHFLTLSSNAPGFIGVIIFFKILIFHFAGGLGDRMPVFVGGLGGPVY